MEADDLITRLCARLPGYDMHLHGPPPDPAPPLDPALIPNIEDKLGFALPPLLIRMLTEIGNGGFGPGYGLMGLGADGFTDDRSMTADTLYLSFRRPDPATPTWTWPEGLLPMVHQGCALYDCLDCARDRVIIWEPTQWDEAKPIGTALFDTGVTLSQWMDRWVRGQQMPVLQDPPGSSAPSLPPLPPLG